MLAASRLQDALGFAARVHQDQRRKGSGVPYVTHLMAVAAIVGEYGGDEDLIVAALLHDSLEDQPERVSTPLLVEMFGWRVARVVVGCSDCTSKPKAPWEMRKRGFLERLPHADPDVKLVVAADKIHNASSLVRDIRLHGDGQWIRFNASSEQQCWFLRSCVTALRNGWSHDIVDTLDGIVGELETVCGVRTGSM